PGTAQPCRSSLHSRSATGQPLSKPAWTLPEQSRHPWDLYSTDNFHHRGRKRSGCERWSSTTSTRHPHCHIPSSHSASCNFPTPLHFPMRQSFVQESRSLPAKDSCCSQGCPAATRTSSCSAAQTPIQS